MNFLVCLILNLGIVNCLCGCTTTSNHVLPIYNISGTYCIKLEDGFYILDTGSSINITTDSSSICGYELLLNGDTIYQTTKFITVAEHNFYEVYYKPMDFSKLDDRIKGIIGIPVLKHCIINLRNQALSIGY